jgi:hypothetical protein
MISAFAASGIRYLPAVNSSSFLLAQEAALAVSVSGAKRTRLDTTLATELQLANFALILVPAPSHPFLPLSCDLPAIPDTSLSLCRSTSAIMSAPERHRVDTEPMPSPPAAAPTVAPAAAANPLFSPFSRLASVEVQLVLQLLDTDSRLAAASTNRRMLAEALQPFSWKYAPLLHVKFDEVLQQYHDRAVPSYSLLRLAPVHLILSDAEWPESIAMPLFNSICNLFCLDADDAEIGTTMLFLQQPSAQHLRQLIVSCRSGAAQTLHGTAQLTNPRLGQLASFAISRSSDDASGVAAISLLEQLSSDRLMELVLGSVEWNDGVRPMLHLRLLRFENIRHLSLPESVFDERNFRFDNLFCSPALAGLECLKLRLVSQWPVTPPLLPLVSFVSMDQFRRGLTALSALRTLELSHFNRISHALLLQLPAAQSLTHLRLTCVRKWADDDNVPSVQDISTLHAAMPQLYTTIFMFAMSHGIALAEEPLAQIERVTVNPYLETHLRCFSSHPHSL